MVDIDDGDNRQFNDNSDVENVIEDDDGTRHPIDIAEDDVQRAIYGHAATEEEWYLGPRDAMHSGNDDALDINDYDIFKE